MLPSKENQVAAEQLKLVLPSHMGGEGGDRLAAVWEGAAGGRLGQLHQSFEGGQERGQQIGKRLVGKDVGSCKGNGGRTRDCELN